MEVSGCDHLGAYLVIVFPDRLRTQSQATVFFAFGGTDIGASIIANTILGVPHYKYSIMGPKTLFQLLAGPYIMHGLFWALLFLGASSLQIATPHQALP